MRRLLRHLLPLAGRRIAGANRNGDIHRRLATSLQVSRDARKRGFQVLVDIVTQGFQWGYIEDLNARTQLPFQAALQYFINCCIECSQGLTATGRCRDERVPTRPDRLPSLGLCFGWHTKLVCKPVAGSWMKLRQCHSLVGSGFHCTGIQVSEETKRLQ